MKSFAEKVRDARIELGLTQIQLGELCDISGRAIQTYEKGEKTPRDATMLKLAKALHVSVKFLSDENCVNPVEDIEKDGYIEDARERYGEKGSRNILALLDDNQALFAGGEISEEQKDEFFQAIMAAYLTSKEEAKKRFDARSSN